MKIKRMLALIGYNMWYIVGYLFMGFLFSAWSAWGFILFFKGEHYLRNGILSGFGFETLLIIVIGGLIKYSEWSEKYLSESK